LEKSKNSKPKTGLLFESIVDVVSEKRLFFGEKAEISWLPQVENDKFEIDNPAEFQRVVSNLINNAIEAATERPRVVVAYFETDNRPSLSISDNGNGIPADVLGKLGESEISIGKTGVGSGSGLGLFHAFTTIRNMGGTLSIESQVGKGTTVTIQF
jgi:signal transduction histidine kinase